MTTEQEFPPAMRDIGVPSKMSPLGDANDSPFVEIRQPLRFGETVEISDPSSLSELREE
jgi:hypothetical protein